jgi:hypothetical protein
MSKAETGGEWIDVPGRPGEKLYWQGEDPPTGVGEDHEWVEIEHEMYIPVSKARVVNAFKMEAASPEVQEKFKHFVELLDGIYHFHFHETLNQLKEDYEYFSPDHVREIENAENPGLEHDPADIKMRERRFLTNFMKLMERGNFNPLDQEEYDLADASSFVFDLPVEANWESHDDEMTRDFVAWSNTPEGRKAVKNSIPEDAENLTEWLSQPKETENQMLIFTRGKSPERVEGGFILQKLNLLVELIVKKVIGLVASVHPALQEKLGVEDEGGGWKRKPRDTSAQVDFDPRWLRRLNLNNQLLNVKSFFGKTLLQEPAFERVICLFRLRPKDPVRALRNGPLGGIVNKLNPRPDEPKVNPISIKVFKNIPMADLEVVYPDKKLKMRPFDKTVLTLVVLAAAITGIVKAGGDEGGSGIVTMFVIFGVVLLKTVTGFLRTRVKYIAKIAQDLYERNLDSNMGVLQYLVDSVEEQEFKESFLAYLLLVQQGAVMDANGKVPKGLTNEDLDGTVENFLKENFDDLEVDFDCDGALDLVAARAGSDGHPIPTPSQNATRKFLPIVAYSGEGEDREYWAVPLDEALRVMDEKWDNFFQYNVDDDDDLG